MKKKGQSKHLFTVIVLFFGLAFTLLFYYQNRQQLSDQQLQSLNNLNYRYGLIASESLQAEPQKITSFFAPQTYQANLLSSQLPEQELIIALDNNQDNTHLLKFKTDDSLEEIIQDYQSLEFIKFAEPNYQIDLGFFDRNKPVKKRTSKKTVKSTPEKTSPVKVAVIDSGADTTHPDLKNNLLPGWDFLDDTDQMHDDLGHGTHIASIIVDGSPQAQIIPLRFTDGKKGRLSNLIKALKYAKKQNVKIVNLSLGLKNNSQILQDTIQKLLDEDIIIVASAGNNNSDQEYYPAAWQKIFAVSALDNNDQKLFISNFGSWVDYSTNGQDIHGAAPGGNYARYTGTSQAAAKLTAKIVEIVSKHKDPEKVLMTISQPIEGPYAGQLGRKF